MSNDNEFYKNIQFMINNCGFPLSDKSLQRMLDFSKYLNKEDSENIESILLKPIVNQKKFPELPKLSGVTGNMKNHIEQIQNYMNKLEYNHTGTQFFSIKSHRSLNGLMENAREIIRDSLPIKCLESVVLGIYLTNGLSQTERFTLSFRSVFNNFVFKHVVLGIYSNGLYGAIGMSRREELMYKPLEHTSLTSLVLSFAEAYKLLNHDLQRIVIGNIISHDPCSLEPISWKGAVLFVKKLHKYELKDEIENFSKKLRKQVNFHSAFQQPSLHCLVRSRPSLSLNLKNQSGKDNGFNEATLIYFKNSKDLSKSKSRSSSVDFIRI